MENFDPKVEEWLTCRAFGNAFRSEQCSQREKGSQLQKLAETCDFGGYRDEALRLLCGITSQTIRRKLLGVADFILKKAVDIAVGMELTQKEIPEISSEPKTVQKVDLHDPCFRCGRRNHLPENCFHKDSECHTCKRKSHIRPPMSAEEVCQVPS